MRTVQEAYEAYRILPSLQLHQLRVAAVGKLVCDHFSGEIDSRAVILACLFHDMGNIIKSELSMFPDFLEPEGLEYWSRVKDDYLARYGTNEHHATIEITKEIGLSPVSIELIDALSFSNLEKIRDSGSFEQKVVEYADSRVGPRGILSLKDRYDDLFRRYASHFNPDIPGGQERFAELTEAGMVIERQLFERSSIKPEDITDASVAPLFDELRKYSIA